MYLIAAAVLLASTSCKKDKNKDGGKFNKEFSPVVNTEPLDSGQPYTIKMKVTFTVFNGCGAFDSFSSSWEKDTLVMKVVARYPANAFCTDNLPTLTTTFTKEYTKPGTYYIKWVGPGQGEPEGSVHRDTVVIN